MKDYKQMADSVLSRVHEYEQQENKSHAKVRRIGRISAVAVPVLVIAVIGTFALMNSFGGDDIGKSGSMPKDFVGDFVAGDDASYSFPAGGSTERELSDDSDGVVFASSTSESESGSSSSSENKADSTSTPDSGSDSSDTYGGEHGNPFIAALPKNNKTQLIGEKITDVEAQKYFKDNAAGIVSSLRASGVTIKDREEKRYAVSNHMIYDDPNIDLAVMRGYCHVSYDGKEKPDDEPCLTVKLNFMDFPVYSGGKLVAIVTLTKENGVISSTPSFGATWYDLYEVLMEKWADKKAKLLFVYAGAVEFIITPDNKVINPMGLTDAVELSGLDKMSDVYTWFYNDHCTYTP